MDGPSSAVYGAFGLASAPGARGRSRHGPGGPWRRLVGPGARGRSLLPRHQGSVAAVGPRRAWTVPRRCKRNSPSGCRPPARVDGPAFAGTLGAALKSAPGARGRSLTAEGRWRAPWVGPRRAWTVPAGRYRGGMTSGRPPARVDGPVWAPTRKDARESAPGARGRSLWRAHRGRDDRVGPRRAWTVPDQHLFRCAAAGRPPARVDGPICLLIPRPSGQSAPGAPGRSPRHAGGGSLSMSAPGARGRSRLCPIRAAPTGVGPRRAWTVPCGRCRKGRAASRPPARVDGPCTVSAPGARGRSRRLVELSHEDERRPPARVDGPCTRARGGRTCRSAPGARGRSLVAWSKGDRLAVGPRRAWTVPQRGNRGVQEGRRHPARVDGPMSIKVSSSRGTSAPGARRLSRVDPVGNPPTSWAGPCAGRGT